jgi:hypothetical protein
MDHADEPHRSRYRRLRRVLALALTETTMLTTTTIKIDGVWQSALKSIP